MYPLLFIGLYYTFIFSFWQLQKKQEYHKGSHITGGDVQHRNFVNFLKCPKTLINLKYNFYDFLNLPLIIPHNYVQTVIFKI